MKGKNSFILYNDLISTVEKLSKEQAGALFMVILKYVNDKNPIIDDKLIEIAFEPIKLQLNRHLQSWEAVRSQRSKSGHIGGLKSGEMRKSKKQKQAKEASASESKPPQAKEAVIVPVTVHVHVPVSQTTAIFSLFEEKLKNKFPDTQIHKSAEKFIAHCDNIGWENINSWEAMAESWFVKEKPTKEFKGERKKKLIEI